ncbi:hypothetical protein JQN72_00875 [Phycicoccus sp. CSK15P-2]|uniref:hypothetical protein n=1 Tax=Phycicoccus sp. CSK15P-2 TaxID=2807627 RepID=UPI00194F4B45|nr:hypothetical protein [Phycicoccus sp. CSK15P-2]MBM6402798.1 hypothetical protein [Phycicoccus sp. CSK15P-2]
MSMPESVAFTLAEARELARVLEAVVVSTHQIFTWELDHHSVEGPRESVEDPLRDYFSAEGGDAWRRLSQARYIVSVALDRNLGEDAAHSLYEGVSYWADERPS